MTQSNATCPKDEVQGALLNDTDFLKVLVQKALRQLLEFTSFTNMS